MSSLAAPYSGRLYDVLALRGQTATGEVRLSQDVLAGGGQVATGIVKLAQWAVTELLTAAGSHAFDSTRGTGFLPQLEAGRMRTEADVFVAFGFAVGTLAAQAQAVETAATPPDEQFADWVLNSVVLGPGSVTLYTTLTSAAGSSRPIILPLPASA
jgi:hypothetical protein